MKRTRLFSFAGLVAAVLAVPAAAQQPVPPPPEQAPPIIITVDVVNVVVSVTDRRNRQVVGLGPDDFLIYEDGVQQKVRYFSAETNLPLRIGLLVDTSNSVRPRFQFEQEAAIDFLHTALRPKKDKAFVMSFDSSVVLAQDFTDDPEELATAIRKLRAGGGTAFHDAIYLGAKKLAEGSGNEYRKMLIVLSDGEDAGSYVARSEALEMARRHEVVVFTVSTSAPPIQYTDPTQKLQNPCKVAGGQGNEELEYFADSTGGTSYCPFSTVDVGDAFARIADELRSQYTLAYTPTNRLRDGTFRSILIETRRKGLRAHHRPGYFAVPAPDQTSAGSPPGN